MSRGIGNRQKKVVAARRVRVKLQIPKKPDSRFQIPGSRDSAVPARKGDVSLWNLELGIWNLPVSSERHRV